MKRRIIKQGVDSHTLTLPKSWIENFHIKAGEEVEVTRKDRSLIITPKYVAEKKSKRIILPSGIHSSAIWRVINAAYVTGYQEIVIILAEDKNARQPYTAINTLLQKIVDGFVGMEIVEQTKEKTIIKELAVSNPEEFENSFKRMFFVLETMINEALEGSKEKDAEKISAAISTDSVINKFSQYCMRLLNQFGYQDYQKTVDVYKLVSHLEQLGDEITSYLKRRKIINKKEVEIFEKVAEMLKEAYSILHKKNLDSAMKSMSLIKENLDLNYKEFRPIYEQIREIYQSVVQVII